MSNSSLYILNPHRDDFIWEPLYYRFIKRRPLKKYNYIHEVLNNTGKIKIIVNDICSGIIPQKIISALPKFVRRKLILAELNRWKKINNINLDLKIHWLDESLKLNENDSLFLFQLSNLKYLTLLKNEFKLFKNVYIHLSHYYLNTINLTNKLKDIENAILCGDSDVTNHPFFKKYFSWYSKSFIISPFYIHDRFKKTINFEEKENKLISTGTFHKIEDYPENDYVISDWHHNSFHYNRRNIFENDNDFFKSVTCYNSNWQKVENNWIIKLLKAQKVSQKKYFNFNIVDEYNKHKLAIVGEEICGFPGIGTFEAMACGCVALINPNTINGIIKDENCYLPFENDWNNISNFNYENKELITISKNAEDFVNNNLRHETCLKKFITNFLS